MESEVCPNKAVSSHLSVHTTKTSAATGCRIYVGACVCVCQLHRAHLDMNVQKNVKQNLKSKSLPQIDFYSELADSRSVLMQI